MISRRLTPEEEQTLREDCLQALRNLTNSRHGGKLFDDESYFRPCEISWEAAKLRIARGVEYPPRETIRRRVKTIMFGYIAGGLVDVANGKREKLYRAKQE